MSDKEGSIEQRAKAALALAKGALQGDDRVTVIVSRHDSRGFADTGATCSTLTLHRTLAALEFSHDETCSKIQATHEDNRVAKAAP